jgi:type IV pilus modification protein PilV
MHGFPSRRQGGFTLVEVLVAFLVLTLGLLAVIRLQPELRQHAELARQRSEATRLAQQDIERLRGYVQISIAGSAPAYDAIVGAAYTVEPDALGSPRYTVERRVDATSVLNARAVDLTVRWLDRAGEPQQVELTTLIAASGPALAAARLLPR